MKAMKKTGLTLLASWALMLFGGALAAQDAATPQPDVYSPIVSQALQDRNDHNINAYLLTGYYALEFEAEGRETNFSELRFNPIMLWRKGKRIFLESELEIELRGTPEGVEQALGLEYATMHWLLANNLTLYAGKFLSPIGAFQRRFHPDWINRSVNLPVGFGKLMRLQAGTETGAGIRGAFFLGNAKLTYNLFVSNGAILDSLNGTLIYQNMRDNNTNKAVGGRMAILPLPGSTLEIGLSGYRALVGNEGGRYEDATAGIFALDFNYVKAFSGAGKLDLKGQYQTLKVSPTTYEDGLTLDNATSAWYAQVAYQLPAPAEGATWLGNVELVARYATLDVPEGAPWGADQSRITLGTNYWIRWNAALKLGVDLIQGEEGSETALVAVFTMGM